MGEYPIVKGILDLSHDVKNTLNSYVNTNTDELSAFQMRILGHIHRKNHDGEIVVQKNLEKEFNIKGSSVSAVIDTLEKNGYIERQSVPGDKRKKMLVITDKAKKLGDENFRIIQRFEEDIANCLTEEEKENLEIILSKISDKVNEMRGK